jgi:hypothetical protein
MVEKKINKIKRGDLGKGIFRRFKGNKFQKRFQKLLSKNGVRTCEKCIFLDVGGNI